ncbi:uncharacterized protein SCHCODRAFT_02645040 [Schizophyllum commune H4-8]|nr:uncharacterized protein SCHCODRAFT_02645040 [Schizophyllum commune H4-8]KAI5885083.1 hypothetical protein SCHCODRAFT_02645040 [Schizophyllum commune H4-8]
MVSDRLEDAFPGLPQELFEHILSLTDTATCITLGLVCHALVEPSRRRAFQRLRMHRMNTPAGVASFRALDKLLESPLCTLTPHIRWVALDKPPPFDKNIKEVLTCFQGLPNLSTLRIEAPTNDLSSGLIDVAPFVCRLPALTSLTLSHVGFLTFAGFASTICALPQLEILSLYQIRVGYTNGLAASPAAPQPQDTLALANLRVLRCYMTDECIAFQREFLAWAAALGVRPPIRRLQGCPSWGDWGMASIAAAFMSGLAETLTTLAVHAIERINFTSTDLQLFDFAHMPHLRSIIVEPVRLTWHEVSDLGSRLLDFISLALTAPALRKLTIALVFDREDAMKVFDNFMDWAELDSRAAHAKQMEELQFVLGGCSKALQRQGTYHTAEQRLRHMMPRTGEKSVLTIQMPRDAREASRDIIAEEKLEALIYSTMFS